MDPFKKRLDQQTMQEKLAGLAAGSGQMPQDAMQPQVPAMQPGSTPEEMAKFQAVQQMMLANSPTKGMVQPNAADLKAQDMNQQSQLDELNEGTPVEVPDQTARMQAMKQRFLGK